MARLRIATALLLAGTLAAACASPEEKLIDRRNRLRTTLDELYESYAGPADGGAAGSRGDAGVVGRLLAGMSRANFDEYCLAIGRGERPFALSEKLEKFMKSSGNARTCRKAAELQLSIEELERKLPPR